MHKEEKLNVEPPTRLTARVAVRRLWYKASDARLDTGARESAYSQLYSIFNSMAANGISADQLTNWHDDRQVRIGEGDVNAVPERLMFLKSQADKIQEKRITIMPLMVEGFPYAAWALRYLRNSKGKEADFAFMGYSTGQHSRHSRYEPNTAHIPARCMALLRRGQGKVVIVDDLIDTGKTIIAAQNAVRWHGIRASDITAMTAFIKID